MEITDMAEQIDDAFVHLLADFDRDALELQEDTVCGIWSDGRIAYFNPAWTRFALNNGGEDVLERWPIGSNLFTSVPAPLKSFYRQLFERSAFQSMVQSDRPVQHLYECSSPEMFRQYLMTVYALERGAGYLAVHSRVHEYAHHAAERPRCDPDERLYRHRDGMLHQCIYCRKMQRTADPRIWDWVPEWVDKTPPDTSHSVCDLCRRDYFEKIGVDLPSTR